MALQPLPSPVDYLPAPVQFEEDKTMANLLDSLMTVQPIPSVTTLATINNQPITEEVQQEKNYNLNVCPFHKSNLVSFEARINGDTYIKCQVNHCPIFANEDSAFYYMSNVYRKLHECYPKRNKNLICSCEEPVALKVSKTEANPGRPYFVCRDRDCRFFQWADIKLSKKNKRKQGITV